MAPISVCSFTASVFTGQPMDDSVTLTAIRDGHYHSVTTLTML